jgi:hypothetical protein
VFDIDIERCPNCGARLKIIAAIEDPPVIVRIPSTPRATALTGAASRSAPTGLSGRNRLR